ncbi:MAG TPA: hypothetical protein VGL36_35695 [Kribbella sp.]
MSPNTPGEGDRWDCAAYGASLPGDHCFMEARGRCETYAECRTRLGVAQQDIYRRIQELAAANPDDAVWADLDREFTRPGQLLADLDSAGECDE